MGPGPFVRGILRRKLTNWGIFILKNQCVNKQVKHKMQPSTHQFMFTINYIRLFLGFRINQINKIPRVRKIAIPYGSYIH